MAPIRSRPDLTLLFRDCSDSELAGLTNALLDVDAKLDELAAEASRHVGVAYRNLGLDLNGSWLSGGLSGEAGDVWFEVEHPYRAQSPPWEVSARLVVFCDHRNCTHDLIRVDRVGETPQQVVDILNRTIAEILQQLHNVDRARILRSRHEDLPAD